MKLRNDLLAPDGTQGLEVIQLTTGPLPSSHIYMEAQIFMSDSRRFLLHHSAHPHGSDKNDPKHQYLVCDLEAHCALSPLTRETGATAPSVFGEKLVYYFIDQTEVKGGRLTLMRVNLDGTDRQTIMVIDSTIPGTNYRPSCIYPLSTISSDGKRLALSCFLGDGEQESITWGLMVFDLEKPAMKLILQGPSWCNVHPQYCRSADADAGHDILIQENHGNITDAQGQIQKSVGGNGADIHVIRDDGTNFRNMPWGRDGNEFCQGHQCWRGQGAWAITSTYGAPKQPQKAQLIEGRAAPFADHIGIKTPEGIRNDLSRNFSAPWFFHFATDATGRWLVTDTGLTDHGGRLFVARLHHPGKDALSSWTCVALPRSSWREEAHIHPFLSPDGTKAFFNSDESGILQAYLVRGLESLPPTRS